VTAAIVATNLSKRYGKTPALDRCSLTVDEGRIVALVGPNGAGKTTLLHLAVALLRPTSGELSVLGHTPMDGEALDIGFVAQNTPLYDDFTVRDHLTMVDRLNDRFDIEPAIERIASLNIPLDRKVETLSGGQRAQIALTLALAKRPALLLLDEPVANLDPLARREFLQLLVSAAAESQMTVVLSSHLITDLERVCDYLIVLNRGQVQVAGDIDDILETHRILIGPARKTSEIAGLGQIISSSMSGRQSTVLVRTAGPIRDPAWDSLELSLEDIVLAYLAQVEIHALPGPQA
jgi:ABC-2 type transport system ATP-binding protein